MKGIWQDIRYAARGLRQSPKFAAVTVLTLALGIGATTAIFSLVNGVLLRPLAYPGSGRLVCVHEFIPTLARNLPVLPVSARHFLEWRQRCSSFESLSVLLPAPVNLTGAGEPEVLKAVRVSANLFQTLRVQPSVGRAFATEEESEGRHHVAVIGEGLWRRKFHASPSVIGTAIMLDNEAYTVIGVLPAELRLPNPKGSGLPDQPDVLLPKVFAASERSELMANFEFHVVARLKNGVTPAAAAAELDVIGAQLVKMAGENLELHAIVVPLKEAIVTNCRRGLLVVLGAIGAVLLIACLNLAILHLVRAERRRGDSALRLALGANRLQLLRQALLETLLLAVLGAGLGMMVAWAGLGVLLRATPGDIPRLDQVRIDANVLFFALLLTGATASLCALLPVWRTARSNAAEVLRTGGRTATASAGGLRMRNALVMVEVSLGVVLLTAAGLLLSSFTRVMRADKGFHAPAVLAIDIWPSRTKYDTQERIRDLQVRLLTDLTAAPGIRSMALVSRLPLRGQSWLSAAWVPGDQRPAWERPMANVRFISAEYFQTMGIPLMEGRVFGETDRSRRVAVISQRLAGLLWPGQKVVAGHQFFMGGGECEVIGVVQDVLPEADQNAAAMVYRPCWDGAPAATTVVVRAAGDPFSIAGSVREAIHRVDAELPVSRTYTMREVLESSVSQRRFQVRLTGAFAICALLLAGLGIYGVVSHGVAQRTREMGIRMAFGARPLDIHYTVLRRGMAPVVLGLLAGVGGAHALGRLLRSLLYEISPGDPLVLAAVVATMFLVAVAACYLPARRAARIDPMAALRYE
jgi:predicted permease